MKLTLVCLAGVGWTEWNGQQAVGWQTSPLLWPDDLGIAAGATTLATGTLPERHGVIGDDEGWPLGVRPASQASWRVQPLWMALAAAGMQTASVDWPGSAPGDHWLGLHVDDRFAVSTGYTFADWAVPPLALPDQLNDLRDLRVHPSDLYGEQLLPIIPGLLDIDQARTHNVERAARALARAATVQAAALHIIAETDCDLLAIHFKLSHELRAIGDAKVDTGGGLTFVRAAIERLRAAAPDRVTVVVGQDLEGEAGFVAVRGLPAIAPARVTDLAAWLAAEFGTTFVAAETPAIESIDPRGRGYPLPPNPPAAWQASRQALLARQLLSRALPTARHLIDQALTLAPDSIDALRVKALCAAATEATAPLAAVGKELEALAPEAPWGALTRALADGLAGDQAAATARLRGLDAGNDQKLWTLIGTTWLAIGEPSRAELASARAPGRTDALLGLAQVALAKRDFKKAQTLLERANDRHPVNRVTNLLLAELYRQLGRSHEAAIARQRADSLRFA